MGLVGFIIVKICVIPFSLQCEVSYCIKFCFQKCLMLPWFTRSLCVLFPCYTSFYDLKHLALFFVAVTVVFEHCWKDLLHEVHELVYKHPQGNVKEHVLCKNCSVCCPCFFRAVSDLVSSPVTVNLPKNELEPFQLLRCEWDVNVWLLRVGCLNVCCIVLLWIFHHALLLELYQRFIASNPWGLWSGLLCSYP